MGDFEDKSKNDFASVLKPCLPLFGPILEIYEQAYSSLPPLSIYGSLDAFSHSGSSRVLFGSLVA